MAGPCDAQELLGLAVAEPREDVLGKGMQALLGLEPDLYRQDCLGFGVISLSGVKKTECFFSSSRALPSTRVRVMDRLDLLISCTVLVFSTPTRDAQKSMVSCLRAPSSSLTGTSSPQIVIWYLIMLLISKTITLRVVKIIGIFSLFFSRSGSFGVAGRSTWPGESCT